MVGSGIVGGRKVDEGKDGREAVTGMGIGRGMYSRRASGAGADDQDTRHRFRNVEGHKLIVHALNSNLRPRRPEIRSRGFSHQDDEGGEIEQRLAFVFGNEY